MAEFMEVVRSKRRMCKNFPKCEGCPLQNDECSILPVLGSNEEKFERIEQAAMKYAEEHPEPVYPTWLEWLEQMGIVARVPEDEPYITGNIEIYLNVPKLTPKSIEQIPADIAEKLGLEPRAVQ